MNFYKHHLGDYDADTAHLSWLEDMAYTRLMRLYYRREAPIPTDIGQVCRLVRATSKHEREAVQSVLNEFFDQKEDGWHNKRCDEEINATQEKATKNREVGKLGGRPRKKETQSVKENNHDGFQKKPFNNPSQTPDTRHQTPDLNTHPPTVNGEGDVCVTPGGICLAMREAGIADTNPGHITLIELVNAGATVDEFVGAANDAKAKGKGFAYAIGIVKKRREEVANLTLHQGQLPETAKPKTSGPAWWTSEAGMLTKGKELGLQPNCGELWPAFRGRINVEIERRSRSADDG